jgi:hypothetical protein
MPLIIKKYVNYIRYFLFQARYDMDPSASDKTDGGFFFEANDVLPKKYAGEWSRHLYGDRGEKGILSFDIELPWNEYNEGVRAGVPLYIQEKVGKHTLTFFNPQFGGRINKNCNSFYDLLKGYFVERDR